MLEINASHTRGEYNETTTMSNDGILCPAVCIRRSNRHFCRNGHRYRAVSFPDDEQVAVPQEDVKKRPNFGPKEPARLLARSDQFSSTPSVVSDASKNAVFCWAVLCRRQVATCRLRNLSTLRFHSDPEDGPLGDAVAPGARCIATFSRPRRAVAILRDVVRIDSWLRNRRWPWTRSPGRHGIIARKKDESQRTSTLGNFRFGIIILLSLHPRLRPLTAAPLAYLWPAKVRSIHLVPLRRKRPSGIDISTYSDFGDSVSPLDDVTLPNNKN